MNERLLLPPDVHQLSEGMLHRSITEYREAVRFLAEVPHLDDQRLIDDFASAAGALEGELERRSAHLPQT
jgi:hypothetical protein